MTEKKNAPNFKVSEETAERLRLLSAKSGYSIAYLIEQMSLLADYLPDSADRCVLGIFPKVENRSVLFIVSPLWVGRIKNVSNLKTDSEVDEMILAELKKRIEK